MIPAICALLALGSIGLTLYCRPARLSPDGKLYLAAARGERVPHPFHSRRLLPLICGESMLRWRVASTAGLVAAMAMVGALSEARGLDTTRAIAAAALFAALPIFRTTAELPVLVDGPALALTAASALCCVLGQPLAGAALAVLGAAVKEHVPVFAALAAWSLWPLVGLAVVAVLRYTGRAGPAAHPSHSTPFGYARAKQGPRLLSAEYALLPWGAALAALWAPSWPVVLSLALGYALLFVAADSTRVYQWAAIPACIAAASAIPEAWLLPACAAHWCNPWRGDV